MPVRLNYVWRVFATGLCFVIFGIGGLTATLLALPLIRWLNRDIKRRQQQSRKMVRYLFHFFIRLIAFLRLAHFDIPERQQLANYRGKLILANHPCLIDVVVLLSIMPNADCVIKAHLRRNPFISWIIDSCGYISNEDPVSVLDSCQATLAEGNNLIIFPEGTRTTPGHPIKLHRGAANIAVRCQANIVGLLINVIPPTLTKQKKWYQIPAKKFTFSIKIKDNVPLPEAGRAISKETRRYTEVLENFFSEELQQYE